MGIIWRPQGDFRASNKYLKCIIISPEVFVNTRDNTWKNSMFKRFLLVFCGQSLSFFATQQHFDGFIKVAFK